MTSGDPASPLDARTLAALREDFEATGDLAELAALLRRFCDRATDDVAAIADGVEHADAEAVRKAAHKLKGSSQTLGARRIGATAANVEAAGSEGDVVRARALMPELEAALARTRAALGEIAAGLEAEPGSPS